MLTYWKGFCLKTGVVLWNKLAFSCSCQYVSSVLNEKYFPDILYHFLSRTQKSSKLKVKNIFCK